MSLVKDLPLLLLTIMHISLTVSKPVGPLDPNGSKRSCEEKLSLQAREKDNFSGLLKDLNYAENLFIERLYYNTTRETKTKNLNRLEGIAIPAGNMNYSSILNSMYEINECLTSYLPEVIGNLTIDVDVQTNIISYTHPFLTPFSSLAEEMKDCWGKGELTACPKNLANNQTGYEMKEYALRVIHTAIKWTESYIK